MKRLMIAAVLATTALAGTHQQASAFGFGLSIGIGINFSCSKNRSGCAQPGYPACFYPQGMSGMPTMPGAHAGMPTWGDPATMALAGYPGMFGAPGAFGAPNFGAPGMTPGMTPDMAALAYGAPAYPNFAMPFFPQPEANPALAALGFGYPGYGAEAMNPALAYGGMGFGGYPGLAQMPAQGMHPAFGGATGVVYGAPILTNVDYGTGETAPKTETASTPKPEASTVVAAQD